MTTERFAAAYGVDAVQIRQNHAGNTARLTEGIHFLKVEGREFKALKTESLWATQFHKRSLSLILWTERGARRQATGRSPSLTQCDAASHTYANRAEIRVCVAFCILEYVISACTIEDSTGAK